VRTDRGPGRHPGLGRAGPHCRTTGRNGASLRAESTPAPHARMARRPCTRFTGQLPRSSCCGGWKPGFAYLRASCSRSANISRPRLQRRRALPAGLAPGSQK
jgi:hypothetical protein